MKQKKSSGSLLGEKHGCIICSVIVKIGVFLVNEHGAFRFLSFMVKIRHPLLRKKRSHMYQNYSWNTAQIFGSNVKQKNYYQKGLLPNIARTGSLQKKRILWTFGLTRDLRMKRYSRV